MPVFNYTAVNQAGKPVKKFIEAETQQQAAERLRAAGLRVTEIKEAGKFSMAALNAALQKMGGVRPQSLVVFSRQFAVMINAGIPVIRCLDVLENQADDPVFAPIISRVKSDVMAGKTLTEALLSHPQAFSPLFCSMVRAAEVGGILDIVLNRLAAFLEKEAEIRSKVKSAMMYPTVIFLFAIAVTTGLFLFVLPTFKKMFTEISIDGKPLELPFLSNLIFMVGDLIKAYFFIPVGLVIGGVIAYRSLQKTEKGQRIIDGAKLRLPIVGDLIRKIAISRFSRTFGTLTQSGVPIMQALEIVADTAGNTIVRDAVLAARLSIREGQRLSPPLAASGVFPPMVTQMIEIGEEAGKVSEMLDKIADFYDTEVDATIKGLTSMIEPLMIMFVGSIVGVIAVAVLMPIPKMQEALRKTK
ncbi:MAG: type II secretion system F family protein [Armatimonadetes bacterium]|nr:type II secretion system F family protein [Armatimonadota bacterium]